LWLEGAEEVTGERFGGGGSVQAARSRLHPESSKLILIGVHDVLFLSSAVTIWVSTQDSETIGPCTEASYNYIGVTRQGINTTKVSRLVGNYELGRTIGEGTFTKVKYARNLRTGQSVAIKIIDKEKVLKHKMVEQVTFNSRCIFVSI
jgi:hypothetical protein